MRFRFATYGVAAAFAVVVLLVAAGVLVPRPAAAQNSSVVAKPDATSKKALCIGCSVDGKTTPRTADGHPDLSGLWNNNIVGGAYNKTADGSSYFDFGGGQRDPEVVALNRVAPDKISQPDYKPEYAAKVKAIMDVTYGASTAQDPQMDCKPLGVPRVFLLLGFGMQIVVAPDMMVMMYETNTGDNTRLIYTDGRPHPKDMDTSYMGDSIGHWEGDTLVVDVAGLNDETWLGAGQTGPRTAILHSDQEHVIERYTRVGDVMTYEATVEDPVMFTKPWVITPRRIRHAAAGDYFLQSFCQPMDKQHLVKPTAADPYICNYCAPGQKAPE
jgi:hypothetical protein